MFVCYNERLGAAADSRSLLNRSVSIAIYRSRVDATIPFGPPSLQGVVKSEVVVYLLDSGPLLAVPGTAPALGRGRCLYPYAQQMTTARPPR
jgi:hypothetical protein